MRQGWQGRMRPCHGTAHVRSRRAAHVPPGTSAAAVPSESARGAEGWAGETPLSTAWLTLLLRRLLYPNQFAFGASAGARAKVDAQ